MKNLLKDRLVLGSAGKAHSDSITVDVDPAYNPDVVHDLNIKPWPFSDDTFVEITAHHVLEHLDGIDVCMNELHRICKKDGVIYIEVPHHTSWCANAPAHKLRFSCFAFDDYFADHQTTWVKGKKFYCLKKEVTFHRFYRTFFLHKLFNKFPMAYERFFCYIFPAEHLKVWFRPVK